MNRHRADVAWVAGLTGVLLVGLVLATPLQSPASTASGVVPSAEPWASNASGQVAVVFQSPFPDVSLVQETNASVTAGLQVDGIVELAAGASAHPRVVAVALPLSISRFNSTPSGGASNGSAFNLTASLDVYPTDLALWNGTSAGPPPPLGAPFGAATLTVGYRVANPYNNTGAVGVSWSVTGWPWRSAGDMLGLESHFSMTPSAALWACSGASALSQTVATCAGKEVPVAPDGTILWSSSLVGLEEDNATGPVSAVAWSPTVALGGPVTGTAKVTSGIDVLSPGSAELIVGGAAVGATSVSGNMSLALSAHPVPPPVAIPVAPVGPLTGNAVVYGGTAVVFLVLAGLGIFWYRRREAQARREL